MGAVFSYCANLVCHKSETCGILMDMSATGQRLAALMGFGC